MKFLSIVLLCLVGTVNALEVFSRTAHVSGIQEPPCPKASDEAKASVNGGSCIETNGAVKPVFSKLTDTALLPDAKTFETILAKYGFGAYFLEKVRQSDFHKDFPQQLAGKNKAATDVFMGLTVAFLEYKKALGSDLVVVIITQMLWQDALPKILNDLGFTPELIQEIKTEGLC